MAEPASRGSWAFQVDASGALLPNDFNTDALRRLWASRPAGLYVGPAVVATGAWHVACHLVAGGCVRRTADGEVVWLEISHAPANDTYRATLTYGPEDQPVTASLSSQEAGRLLGDSKLLGFVEGTSEGRISASGVVDPPDRFGGWMRQNYDRRPGSGDQGGRVGALVHHP